MIGLVLVTHSARLADGVLELIEQMVQGDALVAIAGGVDIPEAPIGTDPTKVAAAVESLLRRSEVSDVLVLMDLGSAIMSAEAALDFLPEDLRARVHLCEAPLVEGALAAAVRAHIGGSLAQVYADARNALQAKSEQLASLQRILPNLETPTEGESLRHSNVTSAELTIIVPNRLGLHARPAARLVSLAAQYDAQVTLLHNGRTAPATSLNQVVTLGVRQGDVLVVRAAGADALAALGAIEELALDNFGDPIEVTEPTEIIAAAATTELGDALSGVPASEGVAFGPAYRLRMPVIEPEEQTIADTGAERQRLRQAITAVIEQLRALRSELSQRAGAAEAGIFDAQVLMISDSDLIRAAEEAIELRRIDAATAWNLALRSVVTRYRALDDPYLARRADDVLDAGQRVLRYLINAPDDALIFAPPEPAILVANDLKPSDVARLPVDRVLGIVTAEGGATGHSAILARSLGIPAVTGIGAAATAIADGQRIALDGENGYVWLAPDDALIERLQTRRAAWQAQRSTVQKQAQSPAVTRDGSHVEIVANINLPGDVTLALANGAEGVGLFRTEFLYIHRESPPSEDEHLAIYLETARRLNGRPLTIRTLDVGGDKPLSYLRQPHEQNPFLGRRGLRYCLDHPGLLRPQIRAILRAAAEHPIRVMFPMVSTWDELVMVDALIDEICADLQSERLSFDEDIQRGIMVETPAAVLLADHLARLVDFFSIGTNDLTQYVMAADRGNAAVAGLVNAYQPAVLHAIRETVEAGHAHGIPVGICGELAGDPRATALLIGLGLDELSMTATSIPAIKARVRQLSMSEAKRIAEVALEMSAAEDVEAYLEEMTAQLEN
ncbi:MAG: multiphosphoryl transfer protein [Chloroflexota bacterium]|nr:phosphoenolpyruvate--protein phosphotransferase [Caldilinea sp.]GIK73019.1 MAG: multiphosphoryl transfer protein [Chloroflexota bacterium]